MAEVYYKTRNATAYQAKFIYERKKNKIHPFIPLDLYIIIYGTKLIDAKC